MSELKHFGILGMRWGVRRERGPDGRVGKSQGSGDYQKAQKLKNRGMKNLSTKELQDLTKRMQLEKQYKELNPNTVAQGKKIVKGVVAAGTTVASAYALTKTPLGQTVIGAIKKAG